MGDFKHAQNRCISNRVNGVDINLNTEQLAGILGISMVGDKEFSRDKEFLTEPQRLEIQNRLLIPREPFQVGNFHPLAQVYCRILQYNILPQSSYFDELSTFGQFLTHRIMKRRPIYLPYILMRTMIAAAMDTQALQKGHLPYGKLLTTLSMHLGIKVHEKEAFEATVSAPLN
ncbi:hypothetical protein NE237_026636 [Protea cynaroides]|uniref:Uncharacterized protein n=1 Tax=Protea cynaroides TaxID=273540 RepID=A0A9Q0K2H4_9MAGN|nr:hypothetical protein NE237_026636 [Protea cynaroides]